MNRPNELLENLVINSIMWRLKKALFEIKNNFISKEYFMKKLSTLLLFSGLLLFGCGGGGESTTPAVAAPKHGDESVKASSVVAAENTAPWKSEPATTAPTGEQIGTAKSRLDGIKDNNILASIASSGKKNKTDIVEDTIQGSIRGSIVYKNTYTFDDVVVGDAYSYSDETEISYLGYEETEFGLNGEESFSVSFKQTSIGNSSYTSKGSCSISYKDITGVFSFFMKYNDTSTEVNGVLTTTSTYDVDGDSYSSKSVYEINGDYTYESTYVENGITYTSKSTSIGSNTTYITTHQEGGKTITDSSSSNIHTSITLNGVTTDTYTYTYLENGIEYTNVSSYVNGSNTSYVTSHIESGKVVIDYQSSSVKTSVTVNGITTDTYTDTYVDGGVTYTIVYTYTGINSTYVKSHVTNGVTVTDESSSSTSVTVNGITTDTYTSVYIENGITYTYLSTTVDGVTSYSTTHVENGKTVIDNESKNTTTIVNGVTTDTHVETYVYDGMSYTSTTTTVDGITTVVTVWVENGQTFTDTYTY